MIKKIRYDIPFHMDTNSKYLPLILAFLTLICCLGVAVVSSMKSMTHHWQTHLSQKYTFELKLNLDTSAAERALLEKKLLITLKTVPEIETVQPLGQKEINDLMRPWFGAILENSNLPLPILVDVTLQPQKKLEETTLFDRLSAQNLVVTYHSYEEWGDAIRSFIYKFMGLITVGLVAVFGITAILVIYMTSSALMIHKPVLQLMHRIGAEDDYIVEQFQKYTNKLVLKGSAAGLLLAIIGILFFYFLTSDIEATFFPKLSFSFLYFMFFISMPLLFVLLAQYTTKWNVLRYIKHFF